MGEANAEKQPQAQGQVPQTEAVEMATREPIKIPGVRPGEVQKSGEEGAQRPGGPATTRVMITASNLNFFYGKSQALYEISIRIPVQRVTAFIGPSGCGKSTFLRTLNRMNDTINGTRVEGSVEIDNNNI